MRLVLGELRGLGNHRYGTEYCNLHQVYLPVGEVRWLGCCSDSPVADWTTSRMCGKSLHITIVMHSIEQVHSPFGTLSQNLLLLDGSPGTNVPEAHVSVGWGAYYLSTQAAVYLATSTHMHMDIGQESPMFSAMEYGCQSQSTDVHTLISTHSSLARPKVEVTRNRHPLT
jgi:hypothetical protein